MQLGWVIASTLLAASATVSKLHDAEPCAPMQPLDHKDPILQSSLAQGLAEIGLSRQLANERLAVAVADLTYAPTVYFAGINDDFMMYAASLPKIAVLLAVAQLADDGRIPWTADFAYRLHKMITVSDNGYASWGVDASSLEGIADVLTQPGYCFYDMDHGGLWVGRAFRHDSATQRDPLKNLSHAATARQTARFYVLLDQGRLVSPAWSERLRTLMGPPELMHKFVAALGARSGVKILARKSGTWSTFHSDSALVQHDQVRYVVVALADTAHGEGTLRAVAQVVDDAILRGEHRRGAGHGGR